MPELVAELFSEYASAYARGERPHAHEFLARAAGQADALARLIDAFLARAELTPLTSRTVTDPGALRALLLEVREQGWALVDQELEDGVRSIAAGLRGADGRVLGALNVSAHATRTNLDALRKQFLPALLETTERINADLSRRS